MRRPLRVLLVEDDPADIELIRACLAESAVHVELAVARDGVEAMDYLLRNPPFLAVSRPDLVLLDLGLPRKSGREVLAEMKATPCLRAIPVIVLSGSERASDVVDVYDLHANCFVRKPQDASRFSDVLRSLGLFWMRVVKLPPDRR